MHDPLLRSKRLTPRLAPIKFSISFLDELLVNFPINNRKTLKKKNKKHTFVNIPSVSEAAVGGGCCDPVRPRGSETH